MAHLLFNVQPGSTLCLFSRASLDRSVAQLSSGSAGWALGFAACGRAPGFYRKVIGATPACVARCGTGLGAGRAQGAGRDRFSSSIDRIPQSTTAARQCLHAEAHLIQARACCLGRRQATPRAGSVPIAGCRGRAVHLWCDEVRSNRDRDTKPEGQVCGSSGRRQRLHVTRHKCR
jgi:hypothetical protein